MGDLSSVIGVIIGVPQAVVAIVAITAMVKHLQRRRRRTMNRK